MFEEDLFEDKKWRQLLKIFFEEQVVYDCLTLTKLSKTGFNFEQGQGSSESISYLFSDSVWSGVFGNGARTKFVMFFRADHITTKLKAFIHSGHFQAVILIRCLFPFCCLLLCVWCRVCFFYSSVMCLYCLCYLWRICFCICDDLLVCVLRGFVF